jgi:hypothetical protein
MDDNIGLQWLSVVKQYADDKTCACMSMRDAHSHHFISHQTDYQAGVVSGRQIIDLDDNHVEGTFCKILHL